LKFKFTVSGGSLVWEDGKLSGDKLLVDIVRNSSKINEGVWIGESYLGGTDHDHLKSPLSIYLILERMFGEVRHEGDKIPLPKSSEENNVVY